jgi:hypothetical protein
MKLSIFVILFFSTINIKVYAQEATNKNQFGFGVGAGYSTMGVKYDREIFPSFLLSANIGFGFNLGSRYKFCAYNKSNCLIASAYYGKNLGPGESGGDILKASNSSLLGVDYEHYFTKNWSFELGLYYIKFLENTGIEYGNNDGQRVTIGIKRGF